MTTKSQAIDQLLAAAQEAKEAGNTARVVKLVEAVQDLQRGRSERGVVESFLHGAGQGATLGFSDEGYGGIRAAFDREADEEFGEAYERHRDEYRQTLDESREDSPWAMGIGEVGGGFLTGGVGGARALGATGLRQLAGVGAAAGGVAGAGFSEADTAGGVAIDTAIGAGAGGVLGPVVGGLGKGGQAIYNKVRERMDPNAHINRLMEELVDRTGMSYSQLNRTLAENPGLMRADLSDDFRALLAAVGGPKEFAKLERRARGTREKVMADLSEGMGGSRSRQGVYMALKKQNAQIKEKADELYTEAHNSQLYEVGEIDLLMRKASVQKGATQARKLWREEFDERVPENPYDMKFLDYIQRGMQDVIQKTKGNKLKGAIIETKNRWNAALDEQVPVFKQARALWRGNIADKEAADLGKTMLKPAVLDDLDGDTLALIADYSPSELNFFKMGFMKALDDKMARTSNISDVTKFIRDNDAVRKALRLVMGPDEFDTFMRKMTQEAQRYKTFKQRGFASENVVPSTLKKDLQRIVTSLGADAFLGTTGAIATHSAYRSLLRNQLARKTGGGEGQQQLAKSLMSNAPLQPPGGPALTIRPQAFNSAAGAAGTMPGTIMDLLGQ